MIRAVAFSSVAPARVASTSRERWHEHIEPDGLQSLCHQRPGERIYQGTMNQDNQVIHTLSSIASYAQHSSFLLRCSRPRQLKKRSISPCLCNLLQVSIPGEQESFHVAGEDQRLSHLPKDAQWRTEHKQINHERPR
jgi:hypothetical protein